MSEVIPFAGYIKPADRVDYAVIKAEIVQDPTTGNKYLKRTLQDSEDDEEPSFVLVTFNERTVGQWEEMMTTALGKLSADNESEVAKLPEKKRLLKNAGRVNFTFPEPMYRVWGSNGEHTVLVNGMPMKESHNKGDIVRDGNGNPRTYTGTRVLVKFKKHDSDQFTETYDYITACADAMRQFRPMSTTNVGMAQINTVQQAPTAPTAPVAPTAPTQASVQAPVMPGLQPQATVATQPVAPQQTPGVGF